jgi:superfamily II DNA/RNA helicase
VKLSSAPPSDNAVSAGRVPAGLPRRTLLIGTHLTLSAVSFLDLGLPASLAKVLASRDITVPTPIQAATLADTLAGRDVLARGRTGSGKTYAFLLPLVARLSSNPKRSRAPRALILAPTRELVAQIEAALAPLAKVAGLSSVSIYGGVSQQPQVRALRSGVDILIACPGRLEDLIRQGHCGLSEITITVLDEADHMADLGFLPPVQRLLARTPKDGQRMLFSATLDARVGQLVGQFLRKPVTHEADTPQPQANTTTHHVLHVAQEQRFPVLADLTSAAGHTVVFTRTKHRAKALTRQLNAQGVPSVELHGDLNQRVRTRNLEAFHSGHVRTLVATDIASRGIHVDDVARVIHADPPVEAKAYLHRSGRTGRAGKSGIVITLTTAGQLRDVRALTRAAGIRPVTTQVETATDPILRELAPGERVLVAPIHAAVLAASSSARPDRSNPEARQRARTSPKAGSRRRQRPDNSRSTTSGRGHSAAQFSGSRRRAR